MIGSHATPKTAIFIRGGELEKVKGHPVLIRCNQECGKPNWLFRSSSATFPSPCSRDTLVLLPAPRGRGVSRARTRDAPVPIAVMHRACRLSPFVY